MEYIDFSTYNGERSILQKDIKYSYQNEYRIMFSNDKINPLSVRIGSLEDISTIYDVEFIDHFTCRLDDKSI